MNRFLKYAVEAVIAAAAVAAVSCGKPRIIPDSTLSEIFYEAFLTNAYIGEMGVKTDSLAIYESIFDKYGYTVEDLQYTIGNFSKRKSARLGNVVEVAIARLESEGSYYNRETAILDTIDARARRIFSRTVYADTLVTIYRLSDTVRSRIVVDSLQRGEYAVSLSYNIDSLDKNSRQRIMIHTERDNGTERVEMNNVMQRRTDKQVNYTVKNDGSLRRMTITLAELDRSSKAERPHMTFRDIRVKYIPYADDVVDSLYERTIDLGIFNLKMLLPDAPDSIPQAPAAR